MEKLIVQKHLIRVAVRNQRQFLSLTDMAKIKPYDTGVVLSNWLNTKKTLEFLGKWEGERYPSTFNHIEFNRIKARIGRTSRRISIREWINSTGAQGIEAVPGRYGGTFAVLEIATEFASWLAPGFKVKLNAELKTWAEWERRADWVRAQYTPFESMF